MCQRILAISPGIAVLRSQYGLDFRTLWEFSWLGVGAEIVGLGWRRFDVLLSPLSHFSGRCAFKNERLLRGTARFEVEFWEVARFNMAFCNYQLDLIL